MRHLMGPLNKFNIAPGSIADISSGGGQYKLPDAVQKTPVSQVWTLSLQKKEIKLYLS